MLQKGSAILFLVRSDVLQARPFRAVSSPGRTWYDRDKLGSCGRISAVGILPFNRELTLYKAATM